MQVFRHFAIFLYVILMKLRRALSLSLSVTVDSEEESNSAQLIVGTSLLFAVGVGGWEVQCVDVSPVHGFYWILCPGYRHRSSSSHL